MKTIVIIGALEEEIAHIAASLSNLRHEKGASLNVAYGMLESAATDGWSGSGGPIAVAATVGGMGLVNAAATAQRLIDVYQPDGIIFSGIAGSLNKSLHINDVVLGGTLRYLDSDMRLIAQWKPQTEEFHSDPKLLAIAQQALDELGIAHITGTIASGNYFVDTPEKIAQVVAQTGADAVEMEGAAVVHVAARNDVPALVVRALSDNADTDYEVFKEFDISEFADTAARLAITIAKRL
ncbi:5'-methylthioadenosine/S-adenosylhomocysteine nucleosidase [Bifidobacterium sp.]|jgi:adenosylhomocysteine nucleosidase|uniref:5'-methylthioadenosine/S-adenosylhomocysteine nucleosidase n=1 Tax=Bifidobacterium sp. TaxID=41200 RepID=UPI0025B87911|nr:5'-methylthioadenosine/S-adenosylhomocysteine nucleosidase [Bifidobacterium sp.]MCH4209053.1 5'-methylthioadenosine/S-adenosylhomocysteine nucleosidase [Bifidobacterium sp.]MCI1225330.1 5'-methylthioadenosine/S-adenosylhomocysteine nucleosidase [Bifidobacterium sp.]